VGEGNETELGNVVRLRQNYLNPFNPATTISFNATKAMDRGLAVFDLLGRQVATLVSQK